MGCRRVPRGCRPVEYPGESSLTSSRGILVRYPRGSLTPRPLPQPHVLRGIPLAIQSLPQTVDHRGDPDPLPRPQLDGFGGVRKPEGSRSPCPVPAPRSR